MVEKVKKDEPAVDTAPKDIQEQMGESDRHPLPNTDFYRKLLHQPSCITEGRCDGCGRCEH